MRTKVLAAALALVFAPLATAYYHFIVYNTQFPPRQALVARFDTSALPMSRLPFLIRETGPVDYAAGDSFVSLVSQVRAAAEAWNNVPTADLKLVYGGLSSESRPMSAPHVEVVFEELPDGVLALGGPAARLDAVTTQYGTFIPIAKSQVVLPLNLASPKARPVSTERFFLTLVHEFGHALGLQHSWTGSVMSTEVTRTTSKSVPLTTDDHAGLSVLYPAASFRPATGSVSGRVMLGSSGINLASVTAVTPTGAAVSALTASDGTYRLDGLPAGSYYIYVHPLPPALQGEPQPVNLELPTDPGGRLLPGPAFDLGFYPGGSATPQLTVNVGPGRVLEGIDFVVRARDRVNMHSVQTYTFIGQEAVKPATMTIGPGTAPLILFGYGMGTATGPSPRLGVSILGAPESVAPGGIRAYAPATAYTQLDISRPGTGVAGHRHLLFTLDGEAHVAPSSLRLTAEAAPAIEAVTANADGTVTITGARFASTAKVLFDGMPGVVLKAETDKLSVAPPPGPQGHRAIVSVLNSDGQSSLMVHGLNSPSHTYGASDEPKLTFAAPALQPGVETVIEVSATGLNLNAGAGSVTFGTSDVTMLRWFPLSESRALAHVAVSPTAAAGQVPVTLNSGLRRVRAEAQVQVNPASGTPFVEMSKLGGETAYPGGVLTLTVGRLVSWAQAGMMTASVDGLPAAIVGVNAAAKTVQIQLPASLQPGLARVQLTVNGEAALPAVVVVDKPPPQLVRLQTLLGVELTVSNAPRPGDLIQALVVNLPNIGVQPESGRFSLASNGIDHTVLMVQEVAGKSGQYLLTFFLSLQTPGGAAAPLTLHFDGKLAGTLQIPVR